jgi:oligopeptide/dipeptide ABC transporter ATP-binding protein
VVEGIDPAVVDDRAKVVGAAESKCILECENVAVSIGGRELLSDLTLRVRSGESLGIVGETGSGKSLACRTMIGLLGRVGGRITRGRMIFDDIDVTNASEKEWRRLRGARIAFVPQASLSGLDPVMTVGRQLTETIGVLTRHADPRARAKQLLELVEMPRPDRVMRCHPHELSGGMRQRAMIALAVAGDPAVLIADEPTTALDVTVQKLVLDVLLSFVKTRAMSLVLVTHDLAVVQEHTDATAIMYAGETVELGRTDDVLDGGGHPYTRALLASRPGRLRTGERLGVIGGAPPSPSEWPLGCRFAPRCEYATEKCREAQPTWITKESERRVRCVRLTEISND